MSRADNRPNVIFFMTDQQRWDALGVANPLVKTPNLDRLARTGIRFDQAVCQAPMCVPSRYSLMFGYYPSQIGVRSNGGGLFFEDRLPSTPLPELMRQQGYQTAGFGKTHWNHGFLNPAPPTRGFEVRAEGQAASSPQYEHGAVMMSDVNPEGLARYFEETKDFGGGEENPNGYIGCTSKLPPSDHRDGFIAEQCLKFLDEGVDPDRPLFLYLSFIKPHAGFNVIKEFEELYNLDDIPDVPEPPWLEEPDTHVRATREQNPQMLRRYQAWRETWEQLSKAERRRTTLRYWANCSWLDSYFGQVLEKLEKLGRLENSLIIYCSDHGDMMGERRHMFSKYCLYDSSVRVPLIISGSVIPKAKRGTVDSRPAELVDIIPTIKSALGIPQDPRMPGLDLLGDTKRLGGFCEFYGGAPNRQFGTAAYMWRKKDWKLILYLPGPLADAVARVDQAQGELYCLKTDPNEWHNLYDDPQYAAVREQMKTELLMHLAVVWAKGPVFYEKEGLRPLGADVGPEEL